MRLELKAWPRFGPRKRPKVIQNWLAVVVNRSQARFTTGLLGPHSGVKYKSLPRRSSAPGEYPAHQHGGLIQSMKSRTTKDSATIGTDVYYARFLREGTRFMARRKMSDDALREGGVDARPASRGWVGWLKNKK